jgi:hypothetical protein
MEFAGTRRQSEARRDREPGRWSCPYTTKGSDTCGI